MMHYNEKAVAGVRLVRGYRSGARGHRHQKSPACRMRMSIAHVLEPIWGYGDTDYAEQVRDAALPPMRRQARCGPQGVEPIRAVVAPVGGALRRGWGHRHASTA